MINKKNSRQVIDGSKNKERSAKMLQNNCNQHYITAIVFYHTFTCFATLLHSKQKE